jgi:hypothetical protein
MDWDYFAQGMTVRYYCEYVTKYSICVRMQGARSTEQTSGPLFLNIECVRINSD